MHLRHKLPERIIKQYKLRELRILTVMDALTRGHAGGRFVLADLDVEGEAATVAIEKRRTPELFAALTRFRRSYQARDMVTRYLELYAAYKMLGPEPPAVEFLAVKQGLDHSATLVSPMGFTWGRERADEEKPDEGPTGYLNRTFGALTLDLSIRTHKDGVYGSYARLLVAVDGLVLDRVRGMLARKKYMVWQGTYFLSDDAGTKGRADGARNAERAKTI